MLSWKPYISSLIFKKSNFIGAIYRKRWLINRPTIIMFVTEIYTSLYNFFNINLRNWSLWFCSKNIIIFAHVFVQSCSLLRALQEKLIYYPICHLYLHFNAMSIHGIFKYAILNLMYICYYLKSLYYTFHVYRALFSA